MPVRCSSGLLGPRCRRVGSSAVLQRTVALFRFVSTCSECKSRENPEPPAQSTRAAQASPHSHTHASAGRRTMAYKMKQHLFLHTVKSTQRCTAFVVLLFLWLRLRFKSHYGPPHSAALRLLYNPQVVLLWVRLSFESLRLTRPHDVSYLPSLSFNSLNESAVWCQGCGSNARAWLSWFFSCLCKGHARYPPTPPLPISHSATVPRVALQLGLYRFAHEAT